MAKKNTKKAEAVVVMPDDDKKKEELDGDDNEDDGDEEYEEDELELLQCDLGDMIKLKQILDESVAATILDFLDEDYRLDNFKLALMVAACLFAVVAQFAPIPFPDSRPVLGICCCCYFILSGILQLITTFIDKDSILLTKPLSEKKQEDNGNDDGNDTKKKTSSSSTKATQNKDLLSHGVRVRSQFPRFSEWYSVILEYQNYKSGGDEKDGTGSSTNSTDTSPYVEQKWSVGQFFDKEGYFDEIGLQKEIELLYERLESQKYDGMMNTKTGEPIVTVKADAAASAETKKNQ